MISPGLIPGNTALIDAAIAFFRNHYEAPTIRINKQINSALGWVPTIHFEPNAYLTVAAEISEAPYPAIFRMRHAEMLAFPAPIAVYCVCPEEEFLKKDNQSEVNLLRLHGYGLITVDATPTAMRRHGCIPLIQFIPEGELRQEIDGLPRAWRARIRESYDKYLVSPVSGVQDISEVLEGLVRSASKRAARAGWVSGAITKASTASMLDSLTAAKPCQPALAALGGARNYIKLYRNPAHHAPKSRLQAYKKYRDAQHSFRDGIKQIHSFRAAMGTIGLKLSL